MELFTSTDRVIRHTAPHVNEKIHQTMKNRIQYLGTHPEEIEQRLKELDKEWDTERTLEANAATLAFLGTAFGIMKDRRFLLVPVVVTAFLLQHSLQGWCPPLGLIRRLGVRTQTEIEAERFALRALRGDFDQIAAAGNSQERIDRVLH